MGLWVYLGDVQTSLPTSSLLNLIAGATTPTELLLLCCVLFFGGVQSDPENRHSNKRFKKALPGIHSRTEIHGTQPSTQGAE